jgi:hypothetical protein
VIALFVVELRRLLGRRLVRWFGLLTAFGIVVAGVWVFVRAPSDFGLHSLRDVFAGTTAPIALAAWIVGASAVGAEWHTGSMTTTLTWEPRRIRLLVAKAAAVVLFVVVATVVVQAALGLALAPAALKAPDVRFCFGVCEARPAWFPAAAGIVLRGAALSAVLGAVGFSIASIGRNTAASVGVGFGYLLVVEGLLAALVSWLQPVLITPNAVVFVGGDPLGQMGLSSPGAAGLLLAAYGVGALAAALLVFRVRDVT